MAGAPASRAKASEKPTLSLLPSGLLPSRANRRAGEAAIPAAAKARASAGIMAFQHEEGEPLPALQKGLVEGAEQFRETLAGELLRLRDRQQLDEKSGQLDDVVVGAPGVNVARPDSEAQPAVERRRRLEVRTACTI